MTATETRPEWLAQRQLGLGASDMGKAETGRYGGAVAVVAEKLGIVADEIDPALADRGHRWEQPIADGVHAHTGMVVAGEQMRLTHKTEPRHYCHPDGLLVPAGAPLDLSHVEAGLEIKTRDARGPWPWDYWTIQSQWAMHVSGLPRWLLAVATIDTDHDVRTGQLTEMATGVTYRWIDADPYHHEHLLELAAWLWDHVERGQLPEPTDAGGLPYIKAANASANANAVADIDDLAELIARREQLRVAAKVADEEEHTIEAKIRHRMGEATEAVTTDGTWRVRCGNPVRKFTSQSEADFLELHRARATELGLLRTVEVLDRNRVKAEMPDEYDALRIATPQRALTVKNLRPETTP